MYFDKLILDFVLKDYLCNVVIRRFVLFCIKGIIISNFCIKIDKCYIYIFDINWNFYRGNESMKFFNLNISRKIMLILNFSLKIMNVDELIK